MDESTGLEIAEMEIVYLVGTDAESKLFEDTVETEAPESPHTIAPPTSPPDSTLPTLVPILYRTACMAVRVPLAMSLDLSASMAEVATMSDSTFRKREEEDDEEWDDEEEDEEMEESSDSNSVSKDVEDEGPTAEDEDPATVPGGQQWATPVAETAVDEPLGLGYEALRLREIALGEGRMPSVFEVGQSSGFVLEYERPKRVSALRQPTLTTWMDPEDGIVYIDVPVYPPPAPPVQTPPSPEWSSGSLPISPAPSIVPSPISSPMMPLTVPSLVGLPATFETKEFLTELGARVKMQEGLIRDHTAVRDEIFSQRYRFRSLEHEQKRVAMNFRAIWRPVLALESWVGQTDAQRAALWHTISDTQRDNQDLQLQLTEERCTRLDLAKIVDSMRRRQEPRGYV
ncbi:hypothetical protein Tco_0665983 [Tanacetum coccineum]